MLNLLIPNWLKSKPMGIIGKIGFLLFLAGVLGLLVLLAVAVFNSAGLIPGIITVCMELIIAGILLVNCD